MHLHMRSEGSGQALSPKQARRSRYGSAWATNVAALLFAAAALAACGTSATDGSASTQVSTATESAIPDVSGTTAIDGTQIAFNDLAGQDTVLWFWAPW